MIMETAIVGIILAAGALYTFFKRGKEKTNPATNPLYKEIAFGDLSGEKEKTVTLIDLYNECGKRFGVDPLLLRAIAKVESGESPTAQNPLDPSYGLMQILCKNDGPNSTCKNKLYIPEWENATPNRLLNDVKYNLTIASQILKWNIDNYGFMRGIAVYNSWSSRLNPPSGPFDNQKYVDKVLSEFIALGGNIPKT